MHVRPVEQRAHERGKAGGVALQEPDFIHQHQLAGPDVPEERGAERVQSAPHQQRGGRTEMQATRCAASSGAGAPAGPR